MKRAPVAAIPARGLEVLYDLCRQPLLGRLTTDLSRLTRDERSEWMQGSSPSRLRAPFGHSSTIGIAPEPAYLESGVRLGSINRQGWSRFLEAVIERFE